MRALLISSIAIKNILVYIKMLPVRYDAHVVGHRPILLFFIKYLLIFFCKPIDEGALSIQLSRTLLINPRGHCHGATFVKLPCHRQAGRMTPASAVLDAPRTTTGWVRAAGAASGRAWRRASTPLIRPPRVAGADCPHLPPGPSQKPHTPSR